MIEQCKTCQGHPHAADGEEEAAGYACPDCWGSGRYAGSISEAEDIRPLAEQEQDSRQPDDDRYEAALAVEFEKGPESYARMSKHTHAQRDHYYATGEAQPYLDALAEFTAEHTND